MTSTVSTRVCALAAFTLATALLAGTPVSAAPGDLFGDDDGGVIPTDSPKGPLAKCENRIAKAVAKYAGAFIKCHTARATGKLTSDAEDACEAAAADKLARSKTLGCAPCTDINTQASRIAGTLEGPTASNYLLVYLFCSGSTPFGGDDDVGGFPMMLPDAPDGPIAKCEARLANAARKAIAGMMKCHQNRVTGKLATEADEESCEQAVVAKFSAVSSVDCDSCTNLAIIQSAATDILAEFTLSSAAYCQVSTAPCDHVDQSCTCTGGTETGRCTADVDGANFACWSYTSSPSCNFPECEDDAQCPQLPGASPQRCGPLPGSGSMNCCVPDCSQPTIPTTMTTTSTTSTTTSSTTTTTICSPQGSACGNSGFCAANCSGSGPALICVTLSSATTTCYNGQSECSSGELCGDLIGTTCDANDGYVFCMQPNP